MKRPSKRPGFLTTACLLAALSLVSALAQDAATASSGQVTKGFSLPQYQDGKQTALITGAEARAISVNRTEITDLKVDLYEGGTVSTTITSPKSDYWTMDNKMRTRFGVTIVRNDMTISAQTMEWEIKEQRGILRQNVKVVLNSLDLSKPAEKPTPEASAPLESTVNLPGTAPLTDTSSMLLQPGNTSLDNAPLTLPPAP